MVKRALNANLMQFKWSRALIIAVVTWFVGSALIAPQLNPLLRGWTIRNSENTVLIASAIREINFARSLVEPELPIAEGDTSLEDWGFGNDRLNFSRIELVPPNQLVAQIRKAGRLDEDILAARLVFTWDESDRSWSCEVRDGEWPEHFLPDECRRSEPMDPVTFLSWALAASIATIVVLAGLLWFSHPLVRPIQRNPRTLLRLPVGELKRLDSVLGLLRRRRTTLSLAHIDQRDWIEAVTYAAQDENRRAELLALRLQAQSQPSDQWDLPGTVFEWRFVHNLPISLQHALVYFPDDGLTGRDLVQHLRSIQTGLDVMLIVTREPSKELEEYCRDSAQLIACLTPSVQTEVLLGPAPQSTLVRALAKQLLVTRISPYQTRGGVTRASAFFGRQQILTRIINREPANYLVVGGRQLGKTSLLKAVERHLQNQPDALCLYVSLRDHRLAPRLAVLFGMEPTDDLSQVVERIAERSVGQRILLLIDEADPFMAHEARSGFKHLAALRGLSDEGRCHFALAGFWDLYAAAVLDYQSPVRNFGEIITIGALEPDACRRLASEPLALLGIRFAQESLIDELVVESGGRANLIAIICQECLEHLGEGRDVIGDPELRAALASQNVHDALAGWTRLSKDPEACRIDRAIVYQIAANGETELADLLELFAKRWNAADIQASLQRLRLAFVLQQEGHRLRFAVPLFRRQLDPAEAAAYLQSELAVP